MNGEAARRHGGLAWRLERLIAAPRFQDIASRLPIARVFARRDGAAIFDLLQGFVASQVLSALVESGILRRLLGGPETAGRLCHEAGIEQDRVEVLLRAGIALGLLRARRGRRIGLARKGAAILGVPGLEAMIAHNRALYADLADPLALLRTDGETELARFWPYVLAGGAGVGAAEADRYSDLMAQSQVLVAQDTLRTVSLAGVRRLMDVGGGTGTFLLAALERYPALEGALVDLPEVLSSADAKLDTTPAADRLALCPQNFRSGPLPAGADAISLVRVLYDHDDRTASDLIGRCFEALPAGGRLIVSEPMSGGDRPDKVTDVYFAFYTMAMRTGRVRSVSEISEFCRRAGFAHLHASRPRRSYITAVAEYVKP